MHVLGYLIWIALSILLALQVAKRIPVTPLPRRVISSLLAVILILSPFWDVILGAPTFNRLCKEQGGLVRREQVDFPLSSVSIVKHPSDRCSHCLILLLMGAATETQVEFHDEPHAQALADHAGSVLYRLAGSSDAACAAFNAAYPSVYARDDLWELTNMRDTGEVCVVGEQIGGISADYELAGPTVAEEHRGIVVVRARRVELRHRVTQQSVATLTHLSQLAWIGQKTLLPPLRSCPTFKAPTKGSNFNLITLMSYLMEGKAEEKTP